MSLFLKQTNFTNWKQFPQHPQIQTRHQWCMSDIRPRLCPVCDSLSAPSVFLKEFNQIPPQYQILLSIVSQSICLWSSQLPVVCFTGASFRDQGRTNVCGGWRWITPLWLKSLLFWGCQSRAPLPETPEHTCLTITGKAEAMGPLSFDSSTLPKSSIATDIPGRTTRA